MSAVTISLFISLTPDAANAQMTTDQAVDVTMQVFGAISGVPIPPGTAGVMKGMLGCAMNNTSVGTCAENVAISTAISQLGQSGALPKEATDAIAAAGTCLTSGTSAPDCMKQIAISQLPPQAQPLATCIAGGKNLADCAENVVLNQVLPQLGVSVGTGLPKDVQSALTDTVGCVANGSTVSTCAQKLVDKELASNGVPPAVVQGVDALENCAGGTSVANCAKSVLTANLPPDAQKLQSCLSGGTNAQTCVANFAAGQIPDPTAAALVGCMGNTTGTAVQSCITTNAKQALGSVAQQAAQQATQQGISAAQAAITNLQIGLTAPQTPPKFPQAPAVLQNLMSVAQGIQTGDWSKVVLGVGPEAVEIAGKIILSIFLTPALGDLLAPVVDAMIQNDVNAFENGMKDLSNANAVGVAQDIFKWYETTFIQAPCALMPSGAFTNTVCNGLASAINWVAQEGGNLAKDILGAGENILKGFGLWNFVDNTATTVWNDVKSVIDDIGHFLGIGDNQSTVVCQGWPSPSDYFANNVLAACLSPAAASATASGGNLSQAAHDAVAASCVATYELCPIANKAAVTKNCGAMADALSAAAHNTSVALVPAAFAFTAMDLPIIAAKINANFTKQLNPQNICTSDALAQQEAAFVSDCTKALAGHFQLPPASNSCANGASLGGTTTDALAQACMSAFAEASPLVGPNGSLCTKWEATVNPCSTQTTFGGTDITIKNVPDPSKCDLIKPPRGWGTMGPLQPRPIFGGQRPPWLLPAGGPVTILPLPLPNVIIDPKIPPHGINVVFNPVGGGTIKPIPAPKIIPVNPLAPHQVPKLIPPPKVSNNGGTGGPSFVNGCSGNAPSAGCNNGSSGSSGGNSAMDHLGDLNTNSGLTGVAGSGNAGGFGPGQRNAPKGLPLGGKPGVVVGAGKPAGPATGGGGPVNGNGGGNGGTNRVNGGTGNAPFGGKNPITPTANAPRTTPLKPPPKPAPDMPVDFGACPGCGAGGTFVGPK